jgi:hypothetical protein
MKYLKPILPFVKLFFAFFLVMAGSYAAWVANHSASIIDKDEPTLLCIALIAVGLTILWLDCRATRN